MVEIRAGTGGDGEVFFAGDLFRMYTNIAKIKAGELLW
jgi:protein subunit release factor A